MIRKTPLNIATLVFLGFISSLITSRTAAATDIDLAAYRGKVVYLDFWASWCGPCRESFPWLSDLSREYDARKFVVIGVNVDQDRIKAERFLSQNSANFTILYDPEGAIASTYKVTGMPSAILIDRSGHVRFHHTGFSSKSKGKYEEDVRILLNEAAP